MRKVFSILLIVIVWFPLFGCQQSASDKDILDDYNTNYDVFDFENIDKAPEATEKHSINDVIKVFFDEWSFDVPYESVAIDIKSNEVYINASFSIRGLSADDGIVQIENAEDVLKILKKYEVQTWKADYTFEDPESYEDGYSWKLWLQFADGTVEKHKGQGTDVKKLTPENFNDFATELNNFVEEKLKEIED